MAVCRPLLSDETTIIFKDGDELVSRLFNHLYDPFLAHVPYRTVLYCKCYTHLIVGGLLRYLPGECAIQWLKKRQIVLALQKKLNFFNFVSWEKKRKETCEEKDLDCVCHNKVSRRWKMIYIKSNKATNQQTNNNRLQLRWESAGYLQ